MRYFWPCTNVAAYVAALFLVIGLTACDPVYGISAKAVSRFPPDETCILTALRVTPGVSEAHLQSAFYRGFLIAGDGPRHGAPIQYFSYRVGVQPAQTATFEVEMYSDGQYHYSDYLLSLQRLPKQDVIEAYPIMTASVREISRKCRLDIAKQMPFRCIGYQCEPGRSSPGT